MMQKKKLKLLLAGLAASTILFTAPLSVEAANTGASGSTSNETVEAPDSAIEEDLSTLQGALTLPKSDSPCPSGCIHVFKASTGTASHTVKIISGTHTIYLSGNISIEPKDGVPAFEISGTANVTLALETGCNAKFDGKDTSFAGLQVSEKGQLTIRGNGSLEATGGNQGGAGIGGNSHSANVGSITILDGTITAQGNCGGAGIGSGVGGAAATAINIKGGTVTAIGSNGERRTDAGKEPVPPGPGIGSHLVGGNLDQNIPGNASGNITISGGTVTAYGGEYVQYPGRYAGGIQAQRLSSENGSTVIYTNDAQLPGVGNATNLNAIIWEQKQGGSSPTKGTVWGNATLNQPLQSQTLELMTGSSLTIGSKVGFDIDSEIKGDMSNKIIDVDNLEGPGIVNVPNKIVTLNESDFTEYAPFNDNKEQTFSGTDKDYTKDILVHRQTRPNATYGPLPVDASKWNTPAIEKDKAGVDKICNAGWYTVTYRHKEESDRKIVLSGIHVAQRDLKDCTIVIPDQVYTGKAEEPEVSILLGSEPLKVEENDYTISGWESNIDVGEVSVGINANPKGNLIYISDGVDNTLEKQYKIIGVPIDDAVVTVNPPSGTYNGAEHVLGKDFKVTVSLDGAELKEKDDYEVKFGEGADLTSAGDIICAIQGVNNYSGSKEAKYTIDQKEITIKPDSMTVEPKDYDGNGEVIVKDVEFDGLVSADKGKVKLKSKGIVDEKNEGHAGEYPSVHFEGEIELEYEDADGNRTPCTNYKVTYTGEDIPLKENAVINKVTPEERKPTHVDPYTVNANGITFDCTIQINRQPGVEYEFKMDGDPTEEDGWISEINLEDKDKASAVFTGIKPAENADDKHIFYVRSKGTSDVVRRLMDTEEVVFVKLPNPKELPSKPTVSYNEEMNPDKKTYTVTIDKLEDQDIEYRIIVSGSEGDVKFSSSNVDPLCNPGTTYIGQIRYKETEVYKASDPVSSDEITTPPITPSGPKYKSKWTRIVPNQSESATVPPGLQEADYTSMSEVTADLTSSLNGIKELWTEGYDKERTAFYDVKIQVTITDESGKKITRDALPGDFEDGGIEVTLPARQLPEGVISTENQFSAVHMFETDEYAEYSAGDIEVCVNSDGAQVYNGTGKGVTFIVNGASPVGIAWSEAPEDPGTTDPGTTGPGTTDPGTTDPTQPQEPLSDAGDQNKDGNQNQTDNTNKDGTDSQNKDSQSIADALKSAIASLSPKTGDTSKLIMWAVIAAAACIAVIVAIRSKMKNGKKGKTTAQKTNAADSKIGSSAKKTSASAAKTTSAATTKKTTTTTKKSTGTTASKTSATAKKSASGTAKKTTKKK